MKCNEVRSPSSSPTLYPRPSLEAGGSWMSSVWLLAPRLRGPHWLGDIKSEIMMTCSSSRVFVFHTIDGGLSALHGLRFFLLLKMNVMDYWGRRPPACCSASSKALTKLISAETKSDAFCLFCVPVCVQFSCLSQGNKPPNIFTSSPKLFF